MDSGTFLSILLSSVIFTFPRKFPVNLYTRVRKLFKNKNKKQDSGANLANDADIANSENPEVELNFRTACKIVGDYSNLTDTQQLNFYGLYKQALVGDCNKPQPNGNDIVELKKWEAWDEKRGLSKLEAKEEYIKGVEKFMPDFKTQQKKVPDSASKDEDDDIFMSDAEYMRTKSERAGKMTMGGKFSRPAMGQDLFTPGGEALKGNEEDVEAFFALVDEEDISKIEQQINKGFDLEKQNNAGMTAIHYAIENDKAEVVKFLCEHYTNLNVRDEAGMTPLHYAIAHENEEVIELLLKKKVDMYQEDNEGETPYDSASSHLKKFMTNIVNAAV